ncbi:hypothetical protein RB628_11145 [Streptomyces sp. ADMS]|uniref:hypothetical protein n=1 Tax=Streptomyces sp. ADMS TaxID=3071415 RepID=UPI00296FECEF|nr:hypothetical protein [Streptomyces sp. ADMS]MDW4905872.1 hypothetical protein [Streptomyces sp. ADMS]
MSETAVTPVPIPSGSLPAGAPIWSSIDAADWAQARPAPWVRPVPALLITVVWVIVA